MIKINKISQWPIAVFLETTCRFLVGFDFFFNVQEFPWPKRGRGLAKKPRKVCVTLLWDQLFIEAAWELLHAAACSGSLGTLDPSQLLSSQHDVQRSGFYAQPSKSKLLCMQSTVIGSMFPYRAALRVNEIMTTAFFEFFELRNSVNKRPYYFSTLVTH